MSALVLRTVAELRTHLAEVRLSGKRVAAVPTMGALHEGHLSLVRAAGEAGDEVVVTIFVNPTQFGPGEDFERYPRNLEQDVALASSAGATCVFAPPVEEMYPAGEQTRVRVQGLSEGLCGGSRPGHFDGVATIVSKLFHLVGEATYCFGQKDYQQLRVIERMARDLLFPVAVRGCPIVREEDGLAMSSRNSYLSSVERSQALSISRGLQMAIEAYRAGSSTSELLAAVRNSMEEAAVRVEYAELREPEDLSFLDTQDLGQGTFALLVAGRVGSTRLIDNVVLEPGVTDLNRGER